MGCASKIFNYLSIMVVLQLPGEVFFRQSAIMDVQVVEKSSLPRIDKISRDESIREEMMFHPFASSTQRWLSQLLSLFPLSKNTLAMVNQLKEKKEQVQQQQQQQNLDPENPETESSRFFFCGSFCSALSRLFSLTCVIFLVLSFATLLSAIFWLFPPRRSLPRHHAGDIVHLNGKPLFQHKFYLFFLSASVQACFRLHKPASKVISHRGKLEKDIFSSLDLRNHTKVTVLSLHQPAASNFTEVKFGVLPVLTNHTLRKDSLTSLRSSFVNLFAQRSSLNLNKSTFGKPTSFQVLKFPGGITVDPLGLEPVSGLLTLVFSFTLDVSLSEIQHKVDLLKNQLELVLHLEMFESFRVVLTNHKGSTISPPVTVRGCVVSTTMTTVESHIQQRSNNLAQPPAKNFGLDNSAFGEVRNVTFTAYPEGTVLDSDSVLALTPSS
ncbi:hypothetical protein DY000_02044941 [Brassica cretica]|uniref:DUF7036 domain-containing protein n=1 Tax=Brassica cretica TaxID=69181 RepID=A0ABQ7F9E6_BRACR|nr:hypothetical protein DY000_02044941 [Brassica cretica]